MNIYWAVLLQFLGDEHIKWFYIGALIFFGHSQVCVCGMSTTWFGVCRRILRHQQSLVLVKIFLLAKLQRTSSLDVFLGYLFFLLSKEKPSFEGGVRICLCKVLFLLGWCWGILRAVNMSGPPTLLLLVWGTWLVVNTVVGGGRRSADEERSCLL